VREFVVPALLIAYLAAYVAQVRGLPIASTLYPYLIGGAIGIGLVCVLWQQARATRASQHSGPADAGAADGAGIAPDSDATPQATDTTSGFEGNGLRALRLPALFLAACALYPAALAAFGFVLSTTALVAVLLRAFGGERWLRATLVALGVAIVFFLFVDRLLGVPLPRFSYAVLPLGL